MGEVPDLGRLVSWIEHDLPDLIGALRDLMGALQDHVHEVGRPRARGRETTSVVLEARGRGSRAREGDSRARGRDPRARGRGPKARSRGLRARGGGRETSSVCPRARARGPRARARGPRARARGLTARARGREARARGREARARGTRSPWTRSIDHVHEVQVPVNTRERLASAVARPGSRTSSSGPAIAARRDEAVACLDGTRGPAPAGLRRLRARMGSMLPSCNVSQGVSQLC
jgi:hypothetical protein